MCWSKLTFIGISQSEASKVQLYGTIFLILKSHIQTNHWWKLPCSIILAFCLTIPHTCNKLKQLRFLIFINIHITILHMMCVKKWKIFIERLLREVHYINHIYIFLLQGPPLVYLCSFINKWPRLIIFAWKFTIQHQSIYSISWNYPSTIYHIDICSLLTCLQCAFYFVLPTSTPIWFRTLSNSDAVLLFESIDLTERSTRHFLLFITSFLSDNQENGYFIVTGKLNACSGKLISQYFCHSFLTFFIQYLQMEFKIKKECGLNSFLSFFDDDVVVLAFVGGVFCFWWFSFVLLELFFF